MEKEDTMSRNGSGTYSLPAGNPVTTGTTISSTWANGTLSDIATALTQSIAYDGQTTPVANLPMGTYAHTGVGNATVRTMYASAAQVEDGTLNYLTSVAGTNTITATAPVGMTGYVAGQVFRFIAAGANTGACTLNLNSIGAKSLVKTDGSALVSGDIASGAAVQVMYDGTNFQLLSDANGATETVTTLTATTKVVTPQVGSSSGSFTIQSANTTAVTVDSSQNVGIGTSSPAQKLHVDSSGVATIATFSRSGGSNSNTNIQFKQATTSWYVGANSSNFFGFKYNDADLATSPLMVIDTSGNVGIGTSSPNGKLQVYAAANDNLIVTGHVNATDGPALKAMDSTATNYKALELLSAELRLGGANNMIFYTGGTGGGSERMRIDSSGNVLVGTTSTGVASGGFLMNGGNGSDSYLGIGHSSSGISGNYYAAFRFNGTAIGTITQNGTTAVAYNTSSDYRLKENVAPMVGALDKIALLKPVTYTWKSDGSDGEGFIAHELAEVCPHAVTGTKDAIDEEGNPQYQGIDTSFLVATLTAAIQEQQAIITELKARIETLEAK